MSTEKKGTDLLRVTALAGGVGGAKLAAGLAACLPPSKLTVIVNSGDDFDHLGLRICPTKGRDLPWILILFCDSNYAGGPNTRQSVSGYILFVKGVPVAW